MGRDRTMWLTPKRFVAGLTLVALAMALTLFAYVFRRGLDLTDESLWILLLAYPDTVMATMDHAVWGRLLALFPWTVVQLRWLTLGITLGSTAALAVVVSSRVLKGSSPEARLSRAVVICFALLGALLYFGLFRPTFYYTTTAVIASNLFAVAMLLQPTLETRWGRIGCLAVMVLCLTMGFFARFPLPVLLLGLYGVVGWLEGRSCRSILTTVAIVSASTTALCGLLALVGVYEPAQQFFLIDASTRSGSGHNPLNLIISFVRSGAENVVIVAVIVSVMVAARRLGTKDGPLLAVGLTLAAAAALIWYVHASTGGMTFALLYHPLAMALILDRFLPVLPIRGLGALLPARPATAEDRNTFALTLALYGTCLVGFLSSNNDIWVYSTMNMGPLFLLCAILLAEKHAERRLGAWPFAYMAVPIFALVGTQVFAAQYLYPSRLHGGIVRQSVALDHPAVLRGLLVSPDLVALQNKLDRQLRAVNFDPRADRLFAGDHRDGMVLLAGGRSVGTPWTTTWSRNSDVWNCAVLAEGLRHPVRRIVGVDLGTLGTGTLDCLRKFGPFEVTARDSWGEITVINPRADTRSYR